MVVMCWRLHWGPCTCDTAPDSQPTARGHYETVNPQRLRPAHRVDRNDNDRRAIERYERDPNARGYGGGVPLVRQGLFGWSELQDGHHRRQAAINTGRRIRVWVDET